MRSLFWEDEVGAEVAGGFGEAGLEDPPEATSRACSEAADLRPPAPLPVLAVSSRSDLSPVAAGRARRGSIVTFYSVDFRVLKPNQLYNVRNFCWDIQNC